ncbi:VOC family protein [Microbacterium sp. X-17]|uniref:VOC family protein n=1 Tax=Microbacterium sp. X-17 TaxID=3144404 RepID=UPI0031F4951A
MSQNLPTLHRVVVGVPDPDATLTFLSEGLDFHIRDEGGRLFADTVGEYGQFGQGSLEITQAPELTIRNVVFGAEDAIDVDALRREFGGEATANGGVQLQDPSGLRVLIEPVAAVQVARPQISSLRPRRLGHINAKSPDPIATVEFYRRALGMALSEHIGEDFFFLRTYTEHHNVGLRRGDVGAIHHLGFEMAGWGAYQFVLDHLDAVGYKAEYGPGKHRPGGSFFTYVRDPSSGLRFELFSDMAHITTGPDTPPISWEAGDRFTKTINIWGPTPPPSFLE